MSTQQERPDREAVPLHSYTPTQFGHVSTQVFIPDIIKKENTKKPHTPKSIQQNMENPRALVLKTKGQQSS